MNQRKCALCSEWVDGTLEVCPSCNTVFYAKEKEQLKIDEKRASSAGEIPLIKIYETDSIIVRFFKSIIRFHQMVFFFIVTAIGYLAASVVG